MFSFQDDKIRTDYLIKAFDDQDIDEEETF
jgi:hypothetical protein